MVITRRVLGAGLASLVGALVLTACATVSAPVAPYDLHRLVRGDGEPAVVFINGNAATLASWEPVEPSIADMGLLTFRSDRDGFGETPLGPRPYDVRDEVAALRGALDEEGLASTPKILVAHSYGGLLAAAVATEDPSVQGVVLVDALLPGEMTTAYTEGILALYRPQFDAVRAQAPQIAESIIPVVEAFPETAQILEGVTIPAGIPVIDIRAETSTDPEALQAISAAYHRQFVLAAPETRTAIKAWNSGHQVMQDRPDIIIEAIKTLTE